MKWLRNYGIYDDKGIHDNNDDDDDDDGAHDDNDGGGCHPVVDGYSITGVSRPALPAGIAPWTTPSDSTLLSNTNTNTKKTQYKYNSTVAYSLQLHSALKYKYKYTKKNTKQIW